MEKIDKTARARGGLAVAVVCFGGGEGEGPTEEGAGFSFLLPLN